MSDSTPPPTPNKYNCALTLILTPITQFSKILLTEQPV